MLSEIYPSNYVIAHILTKICQKIAKFLHQFLYKAKVF